MIRFSGKLSKAIVIFAATAFFAMSYLALFDFGMPMDKDGGMDMSRCPFMSAASVCTNGPLDHVSAWHGVFSDIVREGQSTTFSLFAIVAMCLAALVFILGSPPRTLLSRSRPYPESGESAVSALKAAYSAGILNPKLF